MARFILSHLSPWTKLNLVKKASANDINELLKHHAATSLNGILEYTWEPFVSADILGNTHSSIVDGTLTRSIDKLVKIVSWYDNEVGISNRLAELTVELAQKANKLVEA